MELPPKSPWIRSRRRDSIRMGAALIGMVAGICSIGRGQDAGPEALPASRYFEPSSLAIPAAPAAPSVEAAARPSSTGFFAVARDSIFGDAYDVPWKPLPLRTLFSEGWNEAWVAEPNNSSDSQQGWINAADGNFYRLFFFSYDFADRSPARRDGHTGSYTIYLPLSRRLEVIAVVPFVTSQPTFGAGKQTFPGSVAGGQVRNRANSVGFGDLAITPRVMLLENDDFTLVAQTTIQIPSGTRSTGAGQTIVSPGVQFWWNFAEGWVMRGGFSPGIGTNRQAGGTTLLSQLAIGKTLTPAEVPYFGDFTIYLSTNVFNTVSSSKTSATLTPGFRTHLGGGYYFLGGLEVPVTGPVPFQENAIFWLMKTF